ncbi:MAG: hypothetical protein BKPUNTRY_001881, partial [Candidatus Fervidibacter sp.]
PLSDGPLPTTYLSSEGFPRPMEEGINFIVLTHKVGLCHY